MLTTEEWVSNMTRHPISAIAVWSWRFKKKKKERKMFPVTENVL